MTHMRGMQSFLSSASPKAKGDEPEKIDNATEERAEKRSGVPSIGKRKRPGAGPRKSFSPPPRNSFPRESMGGGSGGSEDGRPMKSMTKRMPPMAPKRR